VDQKHLLVAEHHRQQQANLRIATPKPLDALAQLEQNDMTNTAVIVVSTATLENGRLVTETTSTTSAETTKPKTKKKSSTTHTVPEQQAVQISVAASPTKHAVGAVAPRLRREEQHGSWIDNVWIPPAPWRHFSSQELYNFYKDRSVLWIGDDLANASAIEMYDTLNRSSAGLFVGKPNANAKLPCKKWAHTCRAMPGSKDGLFTHVGMPCIKFLRKFVMNEVKQQSNRLQFIDTVIVAMGNGDANEQSKCAHKGKKHPMDFAALEDDTTRLLGELQAVGITVVWRTSGYNADGSHQDFVKEMNNRAMHNIEQIETAALPARSNLTYVDWGGAMFPRSFGDQRISGDNGASYGPEAHHMLVQMVTNHLALREGRHFATPRATSSS